MKKTKKAEIEVSTLIWVTLGLLVLAFMAFVFLRYGGQFTEGLSLCGGICRTTVCEGNERISSRGCTPTEAGAKYSKDNYCCVPT